jgi:nickel-dependent lactate racemase
LKVEIPYGHDSISMNLERRELIGVFSPLDFEDVPEAKAELIRSIESPIGGRKLSRLINPGKKVAITVDDNTRPTPIRTILPVLLGKIRSLGVKNEDVTILVALGTHRPMTDREMREKYGPEVLEEYTVINHEWDNPSELRPMGVLPGGVPIWINKTFMEADVRIGVGNIVPHMTSGWAAGSKILLPGLAGEETVAGLHYFGAKTTPNAVGKDLNSPRTLMDNFAKEVGLHMIINTVLTRNGKIGRVYSGDFVGAHREGVKCSKRIYGIRIPQLADITIASSHPADIEFWQAEKGLFSADLSTREGGGILLVTPCPEGISVTHKKWTDLLAYNSKELEEMIERKEVDDLTAASLALCVAKIREPYTICLCSHGISDKEAEKLHFKKFDTPREALEHLSKKLGGASKKLVLTHGGETYPIKPKCAET